MKILLRIVLALISAVAAYYFTFFIGGAVLLSKFPRGVAFFAAVAVAVLAAALVWMFTQSARRGLFAAIVVGALVTGGLSFCAGFFGPILLDPKANQGPMLGFVTGPAGLGLGAVGGAIYWLAWGRRIPSAAGRS